jgi:hypothetical protein
MDAGADFQTLATFHLTFLAVFILRVSLLVPLLFTARITLLSSGDTALLTTAGKAAIADGPSPHEPTDPALFKPRVTTDRNESVPAGKQP